MPQVTRLSVIIPVKYNGEGDLLERLRWKKITNSEHVEIILVDDGSKAADGLVQICNENGWKYIRLDTESSNFSLARSRNAGIRAATSDYLYFEDADLLHKSNFYDRLLDVSRYLEESPFNFAAIPILYLTQDRSENILKHISSRIEFDREFDNAVAELQFISPEQENQLVESYATVGSNILVKRETCFHIGLFDEYFQSWGGEDRDFIFRLLHHNSSLLKPKAFGATDNRRIYRATEFEGWRSLYLLHGEWTARMGIYSIHIFHPTYQWKDGQSRSSNLNYAMEKAFDIAAGRIHTTPCAIPGRQTSIFIGESPQLLNDKVMEVVGSVIVKLPDRNLDPEHFSNEVLEKDPRLVFFNDIHLDEWLMAVWMKLRQRGVDCVSSGSGALPNSIYFLKNTPHFNAVACAREEWLHAQPIDSLKYAKRLKRAQSALTPRNNLSIQTPSPKLTKRMKTVLVILQSPTENKIPNVQERLNARKQFHSTMEMLAKSGTFNLLFKDLSKCEDDTLGGLGQNVDEYSIYDLFEISDVVVTMDSDTGLLALASGTPVVTFCDTFYTQAELAVRAASLEEMMGCINSPVFNRQAIDQFFGFLVNERYSFLQMNNIDADEDNEGAASSSNEVFRSRIVIDGFCRDSSKKGLNRDALIMSPFASYFAEGREVRSSLDTRTMAREAFHQKRFLEAARLFDSLLPGSHQPNNILRSAAEAYAAAGLYRIARLRLYEAESIAPKKWPIRRRIVELSLPNFMRRTAFKTDHPFRF